MSVTQPGVSRRRRKPPPPGWQVAPWLPPDRVCACRQHILREDGAWYHCTWTDTRPMPGRWPPCDRAYAIAVEEAWRAWEKRDVEAVRALLFLAIEEEREI